MSNYMVAVCEKHVVPFEKVPLKCSYELVIKLMWCIAGRGKMRYPKSSLYIKNVQTRVDEHLVVDRPEPGLHRG